MITYFCQGCQGVDCFENIDYTSRDVFPFPTLAFLLTTPAVPNSKKYVVINSYFGDEGNGKE